MSNASTKRVQWLKPWVALADAGGPFVEELRKEVPPGHALHDVPVVALGRRVDVDDFLFAVLDGSSALAVVHLSMSGGRESDPMFPWTTLYDDWRDFAERRLQADHREYLEGGAG